MAKSRSILVVEDETDLAELLRFNLQREGYACRVAHDGQAALAEARRELPDLIVLDRLLPGLGGDEVATELRRDARAASVPILMLTAKTEESDQLVGFALGADDYVTKPFSMKVLVARVGSLLRRTRGAPPDAQVHTAGPIMLDFGRHEVRVDGKPVAVTVTEFKLLAALMSARGRVLTRNQLIDKSIGPEVAVTPRAIDVHVTGLRRKLGKAAAWVRTVRGVGYTFRETA